MDLAKNMEELENIFKQDPLKALEICKEWIHQSKNRYPKYMSFKQWASTFGYIPEGGIRHLIFSNPNFNNRVVKRVGKKILLDVQALELWISEQNDHQAQ